MKSAFLIDSSQLQQAFESEGGSGAGSGFSRRTFIKRTGAATVATLVAWNAASDFALAASSPGDSWEYSLRCDAHPTGGGVELLSTEGVTNYVMRKVVKGDSWGNGPGTDDHQIKVVLKASGPSKHLYANDVYGKFEFWSEARGFVDSDMLDGSPWSEGAGAGVNDVGAGGVAATDKFTLSLRVIDKVPKCLWSPNYGPTDNSVNGINVSTKMIPAAGAAGSAVANIGGGGGTIGISIMGNGATVGMVMPTASKKATAEMEWQIWVVRRNTKKGQTLFSQYKLAKECIEMAT